jgi:hypothetical protein
MLSELESTTEESTDMARRRSKRRSRGGSSLAEARERMEEKGTVGAFGKATSKKIAKGKRAGGVQKKRAIFAEMAKRHFKPLPKRGRRK